MYAGKLVRVSEPLLVMVIFMHLSKEVLAQAALTGLTEKKINTSKNNSSLKTG